MPAAVAVLLLLLLFALSAAAGELGFAAGRSSSSSLARFAAAARLENDGEDFSQSRRGEPAGLAGVSEWTFLHHQRRRSNHRPKQQQQLPGKRAGDGEDDSRDTSKVFERVGRSAAAVARRCAISWDEFEGWAADNPDKMGVPASAFERARQFAAQVGCCWPQLPRSSSDAATTAARLAVRCSDSHGQEYARLVAAAVIARRPLRNVPNAAAGEATMEVPHSCRTGGDGDDPSVAESAALTTPLSPTAAAAIRALAQAAADVDCALGTAECTNAAIVQASTHLKAPRGYMDALVDGSNRGSLGTCAFVGGAASLKGAMCAALDGYYGYVSCTNQGLGAVIDSHDSVWRFQSPVHSYADDVGVKTTVLWSKAPGMASFSVGLPPSAYHDAITIRPDLFQTWHPLMSELVDSSSLKHRGASAALVTLGPGAQDVLQAMMKMYRIFEEDVGVKPSSFQKQPKSPSVRAAFAAMPFITRKGYGPSAGFVHVFSALSSKLCSSVSLYGFGGGGDRGARWYGSNTGSHTGGGIPSPLAAVHLYQLEHYVYRALMAAGQLCIYGD